LARQGVRSYLSEPDRGRRHWEGKAEEQAAVYANRRRVRGKHGKALLRKRGELLERPFAHCYETGGMRRTHLRGHANILKRLLVHVDNAHVRVDQNGLTKNQLESIKLNPRLEAPHKGERIDTFAKETVAEDEYLAHLKITPRFQYGPDFYDPINNVWYDITTLKQWLRHEKSVRRFTWCDVGRNAKRRRP